MSETINTSKQRTLPPKKRFSLFAHGFMSDERVLQCVIGDSDHSVCIRPVTVVGFSSIYDVSLERLILQVKEGASVFGLSVDFDDEALLDRFAAVLRGEVQVVEGHFDGGARVGLLCFNVLRSEDSVVVGQSPSPQLALEVVSLFFTDLPVSGNYPPDRRWKGALLAGIQRLSIQVKTASVPQESGLPKLIRREPIFRGYLRVDDLFLKSGAESDTDKVVRRSVASWGDMVFVLPFDPIRRRVLLVEQFRPGRYVREGGSAMCIGPIGGRCDREESAAKTARREALEEAGVMIQRLKEIPGYYSSPGLSSEFVQGFIGEANLEGVGGKFGNAWEGEETRAFCVSIKDALKLLNKGDISVSHGVVALLYLINNEKHILKRWRQQ